MGQTLPSALPVPEAVFEKTAVHIECSIYQLALDIHGKPTVEELQIPQKRLTAEHPLTLDEKHHTVLLLFLCASTKMKNNILYPYKNCCDVRTIKAVFFSSSTDSFHLSADWRSVPLTWVSDTEVMH